MADCRNGTGTDPIFQRASGCLVVVGVEPPTSHSRGGSRHDYRSWLQYECTIVVKMLTCQQQYFIWAITNGPMTSNSYLSPACLVFQKEKKYKRKDWKQKTQMRCRGKVYEHTKVIHSLAQKLWPWIDLAWHTLDNECIHKHTFRPLFILIFIQMIHKHDLRHAVQHNKGNAVAPRIKETNLFSYSQHRSRRERHQGTVQE